MRKPLTPNKVLSTAGIALYFTGLLLTLLLAILAIWADYEALFYGFVRYSNEPVPEVSCPILVTPNQPAFVVVNFTNPLDKEISLLVRTNFSGPGLLRAEETRLSLAPRESKQMSWQVGLEQVDLGRFIFAQISHLPASTLPYRQSMCGMVMMNVPFLSGEQLFAVWFFAATGSLVAGVFLCYTNGRLATQAKLSFYNAMRFMAVTALCALLAGMQGWWMPGAALLVVCIISVAAGLGWKLLA
ncbi:MAG: hypothetical protein ACOYYS_01285 [Chloroflexota bacterium]